LNTQGTALSSARFDAPRAEAPRGAPRAALASRPASDPVAAAAEAAAPAMVVDSFEGLIALAAQRRDLAVKAALERDLRLVRCEDGRLDVALEPSASKTLVNDLARKFTQWTGRRWMVVVSAEPAQPTMRSQLDARQAELKTGVRTDPLVQAVLARFPGAEIVNVRAPDETAVLPATGAEEMPSDEMPEMPPVDEDSYGAEWTGEDPPEEP